MRRFLAILTLPLALAACSTTSIVEALPASAYTALSVPDRSFQSEDQVIDFYLNRANIGGAQIDREIGRDGSGLGSRMILVTTDGYRDDSVIGEQWRIVLSEADDGYRVLQAGIRYNCARGQNPGWSRDLCP
ncbi:MAG: hypothetical protein WA957_11170 [Alteraurantiacibacter sp.]